MHNNASETFNNDEGKEDNEGMTKPSRLGENNEKERKIQLREEAITLKEISVKEKMRELKEIEEQGKRIKRAMDRKFEEREKAVEDEKILLEDEQVRMNVTKSKRDSNNHDMEEDLKRKAFEFKSKQ